MEIKHLKDRRHCVLPTKQDVLHEVPERPPGHPNADDGVNAIFLCQHVSNECGVKNRSKELRDWCFLSYKHIIPKKT